MKLEERDIYRKTEYDREIIYSIQRYLPTDRAEFAARLMERIALATAKIEGEDSCGRAKMKLLTPEEIVSRACNISEIAFREFENREWYTKVPSVEDALSGKEK